MSDIHTLAPVTEDDYNRVEAHITAQRDNWQRHLEAGLTDLTKRLAASGFTVADTVPGPDARLPLPAPNEVTISARLKDTKGIVAKMRRFGEPLRVILDIWGYRVVVPTEADLEEVGSVTRKLWKTPTPEELLLRHGELQFDWWRDYRKRNHAGLSPATTSGYDQAIHLNRRAPWGIVEIQVMTADLYVRAHLDPTSEDNHDRFVARRQELFRPETS